MKKDGSVDLRVKKTKRAIKTAFFELLSEQSFEHISVKDITDRAMISRNTFYLHYSDKYELFNSVCDNLMRTLFFRISKQLKQVQNNYCSVDDVSSIIELGLLAVEEDREQYRILFSGTGADMLTHKINNIVKRFIDFIKDDISGISDLSIEYIVSGITGIIKHYVLNGVDNLHNECLNFTRIHFGSMIEIARQSQNKEEQL